MFLTDLNDEELEEIANHSFSLAHDDDHIDTIFYSFRVKLLCSSLSFNNHLNCSSITPRFIKSTIDRFNYFYSNNTNPDFITHKEFIQNIGNEDYDEVPDIDSINYFLDTIDCKDNKAHHLYAFGLLIAWGQENSSSFHTGEKSESSSLSLWFAHFYICSNTYFSLWDPLIISNTVKDSISRKNSKAAKVKHQNSTKTKEYAINLFSEGKFKSVKQASLKVSPDVIIYGESVGFKFSTPHQAVDTIYKWLLSHDKT